MKQGCERRQMANYKLYGGPAHTVTQCVHVCHENNGCNGASTIKTFFTIYFLIFILSTSWYLTTCVSY